MMVQFPVWLDARTKGGDNFPLLWVGGHNPLWMRGTAGTLLLRFLKMNGIHLVWSVGLIYHEPITGHVNLCYFMYFFALTLSF